MSKRTPTKQREGQAMPTSQKQDRAAARPSSGSLPRAATAGEVLLSHSNAAGGSSPTHDQIAARAYQLWEAHGRRAGTDREDWFQAERLLHAESQQSQSGD
jgi:Protein of unknown function (DUF2934)